MSWYYRNNPTQYHLIQDERIKSKPEHFQMKSVFWLERTVRDTRKRINAAQKWYKKSYDAWLRGHTKTIHSGDDECLLRERKDPNESHHKLAAVVDGSYFVKSVEETAVVIEIQDQTINRGSRSSITLKPQLLTKKNSKKSQDQ